MLLVDAIVTVLREARLQLGNMCLSYSRNCRDVIVVVVYLVRGRVCKSGPSAVGVCITCTYLLYLSTCRTLWRCN